MHPFCPPGRADRCPEMPWFCPLALALFGLVDELERFARRVHAPSVACSDLALFGLVDELALPVRRTR